MRALLQSLFGNSLARILSGAGLSVVSYAALVPVVLAGLNLAAAKVGGIAGDLASLALLSGVGEGMSIVGSAAIARMSIASASVGIGKAAQS